MEVMRLSNDQIGLVEIVACAKNGKSCGLGDGVSEAVTEIEGGGVAAFAKG